MTDSRCCSIHRSPKSVINCCFHHAICCFHRTAPSWPTRTPSPPRNPQNLKKRNCFFVVRRLLRIVECLGKRSFRQRIDNPQTPRFSRIAQPIHELPYILRRRNRTLHGLPPADAQSVDCFRSNCHSNRKFSQSVNPTCSLGVISSVIQAESEGTCQPVGQRPRPSSTAYQLYKRPYSFIAYAS